MAKIKLTSPEKEVFEYNEPVDGFRLVKDMLAANPDCVNAKKALAIKVNGVISGLMRRGHL